MTQILNQKTEQVGRVIDARGPRFAATLTTVVLAVALVTGSPWIALAQTLVFAIGAIRGPQFTPYAWIFKTLVKPRLSGATPTEDVRPPQFAQSVGLLFGIVATVAAFAGLELVATIAISFALAAAFLNAAFNFCLGCEIYLLLLRARRA